MAQPDAMQAAANGHNSAADRDKSPLPAITLPKGGGAIRDIGEKFQVNGPTGTGSITVPLPLSPGRPGFGPKLNLSYDSGAGNGPFGFGWRADLPAITRKTDKGLPRYLDEQESDVFILSGMEDLVPVLDASGNRLRSNRTVHGTAYQIAWYRPRIEGLFARIERWCATATGISHWRCITRDNVTTLYGLDPGSRIADPADPRKTFTYLPSRTFDDKGNITVYEYLPEDGTGVDLSAACEANRTPESRSVQRYLKTIRYGNAQPYTPDWSSDGEPPLSADWYFQAVFDYGDHDLQAPTPTPDQLWPVRPDPFSHYRAGFEVRTYRRCARVLMFHNFATEPGTGPGCLVRSTDLGYSDQKAPADPANPIYTFLASVTQSGYRRQDAGGYRKASMPPLEFSYSNPQIQPTVLTLHPDSLAGLPHGIDGSQYRWVDLDGEGLAGILADVGGAWTYKRNLSAANQVTGTNGNVAARARFSPPETIRTLPSRTSLDAAQRLMDLSADGRLDVVALAEPEAGYFERTEDWTWAPLSRFASLPQLDWTDKNVTFADITGAGLADILLTEDGLFTSWASRGERGFGPPEQVRVPFDERLGPAIVLADGTETIFLADMTGDGLSDLVRVRNGEVCYWPNLGYGRFAAKVTMDGAPRLTYDECYDPRRVHLADIDGSGTADLIYVGDDGVSVCFNRSGNSWAQPQTLAVFPSQDLHSRVDVLDLLGSGTACLVWSSLMPSDAPAPLRYVDLMGGGKPHLLTSVSNNLGAETRITYVPSTRFYVADKLAGQPWVTRVHFPVQVVERVETYDWIGRSRFVSRYAYHHGYFDGQEREFRGFGRVEQWDTEEHRQDTAFPEAEAANWDAASWMPPVMTRTWYHTGAFAEAGLVSRHLADEYWVEPALRVTALATAREVSQLGDSMLPDDLSGGEDHEAYRALKGLVLRTEVYANDASAMASNPYSVTEHNYQVTLLQHRGPNRHAAFYTHPRETLTFDYERTGKDPRVTHDAILATDAFGNELRGVSVAYPRRADYDPPEPTLTAAFQAMLAYDQTRLHVRGTQNSYTNDLADPAASPDAHRTPLIAETIEVEITTTPPPVTYREITNLFRFQDLDTLWQMVWSGARDVPYEQIPNRDVDGVGMLSTPARRIVGHTQVAYRSDDLTGLLPLNQLEPLALPGQSYRLALTPGLIQGAFGSLVTDSTLREGGYVQPPGQQGWWVPSGRIYYSSGTTDTPAQELASARADFFLPRRSVDPFGGAAYVGYDPYKLLPTTATDPVGNATVAVADYRVLQPVEVTDPNGNRTAVAFDALGLVAGTAVMGKTTENVGDSLSGFAADLDQTTSQQHFADPLTDPGSILGSATTRILYDLAAYYRTRSDPQPSPPTVYTLARETHVSDLGGGQTRYQHAFSYGDGFGREIQRKILAGPGSVTNGGPAVSPRWIASGWTILNNKDKPVRKYEPFFTATKTFEFAPTVGVSSVLFYDPPGRLVSTLHPDSTWEKVVFDCWRQENWDGNDTVLVSDPRTDPDVGSYFTRLLGAAPNAFTSWHDLRISRTYGSNPDAAQQQQTAATKTQAHAATPTVAYFDTLGRTCLTVADNARGERYPNRVAMDTQGKQLAIFDALGRRAMEYIVRAEQAGGTQYLVGRDLTGSPIYQNGIDNGVRQMLGNVVGKPIRAWDARGHAFRIRYDLLQRQTHNYVSTSGAPEFLIQRSVYGEGKPGLNLCGRLFRQYDPGGLASNDQYDFKGNLVSSTRQFTRDYHQSPDWSPLADLTTAADLDIAASPLLSSAESFSTATTYDALNRPIQVVTPHSATMHPNVLRPGYNQAQQLTTVDVWLQEPAVPAGLLAPSTASLRPVTAIDYNARNQRTQATAGNGTVTRYTYDPQTFRLTELTTGRPGSFPASQQTVQDLSYYYDPVGNITHISDTADTQNVIFFRNQRVEPSADYTYDAIYRLISATGREHLGQTGNAFNPLQQVTNDDSFRLSLPQPGDGNAMGNYTETYTYDRVGNVLAMAHHVASGSWTQRYSYAEPSQITPAETGNRLSATSMPGNLADGPYSAMYGYDPHGNITHMPHLPGMAWDELDRLRSTTKQVASQGIPGITHYVYSADAQRLRKTTDLQAAPRETALPQKERFYLGEMEIYREFAADGTTVTLERETLHVDIGQDNAVLLETRTTGTDPAPAHLRRYQYANHLGSAILELDDQALIISYEEYFPYGSTSYQAVRSQTELPKCHRYTGKERDEENDLYYHGARYYAPWLARWTSVDPAYVNPMAREDHQIQTFGMPGRQHDVTLHASSGVTYASQPGRMVRTSASPYVYVDDRPAVARDPDGNDAVLIAYPDYRPEIPHVGRPLALGHAGVLLINNKTGVTKYYEYGRYDKAGVGLVQTQTVPNVVIRNGQPTPESLNAVLARLSTVAGHGGRIRAAYVTSDKFDDMDRAARARLAKNSDPHRAPYSITDNNCATFSSDIVKTDPSVAHPWFVLNPSPNNIVDEYIEEGHREINFTPTRPSDLPSHRAGPGGAHQGATRPGPGRPQQGPQRHQGVQHKQTAQPTRLNR
jgi:RHS repeat-associated protein